MKTELAKCTPFESSPQINSPSLIAAPTGKPMIYRVPITGERPINLCCEDLPAGLYLDGQVIRGTAKYSGTYTLMLRTENRLGECCKNITLQVAENRVLATPLMGFTGWNAFRDTVTDADVRKVAKIFVDEGYSEYGYSYINIDSSWQGEYGGEFGGTLANERFPDMKGLCGEIHNYGLKCGIYSTPMRTAWGLVSRSGTIPGCTAGERDMRFEDDCMGGIGLIHLERECARQWADWGFDYLKYDWHDCDIENAERMRLALDETERAFGFCVTVRAHEKHAWYWRERCSSWRCNSDSNDIFDVVLYLLDSADKCSHYSRAGHYFDLDMLEIGYMHDEKNAGTPRPCRLSADEQVFAVTMRAFFQSPIQISCHMELMGEFQKNLLCNPEVIAVNQDSLSLPSEKLTGEGLCVYKKRLESSDIAYALFNRTESDESYSLNADGKVRDLWARKNIGEGKTEISVPAHGARLLKVCR